MSANNLIRRLLLRAFRTTTTSPIRRSPRPVGLRVESLEDRTTPATFAEAGTQLDLDLDTASTTLQIVADAAGYTLTLVGGDKWSGTDSANVTGDGSATLTVTAAGQTAFTAGVNITDSAAGAAVKFNNSTGSYVNPFAVTLDSDSAGITFTGTSSFGAFSLDAQTNRNIVVNFGASVTSTTGNLTLSANQQATPTSGDFVGVEINGGTVRATGTGNVTVRGRGGDTGIGQFGVEIFNGGVISGGTSGANIVEGKGGANSGTGNYGVYIDNAGSKITSAGGDISVTGTGGGIGASGSNYGVVLSDSGLLTAGGTGTVTVVGNGGDGTAGNNFGVRLTGSSEITSGGGDVSVTGTGTDVHDVSLTSASTISSGGNGNLTIAANSFSVASGTTIRGGAASDKTVTIVTRTAGTAINLGGLDSPGILGLGIGDLEAVNAGTFQVGDADTGTITVSKAINPPNVTGEFIIGAAGGGNVNLNAGVSTTGDASLRLVPNITLVAPTTLSAGAGDITLEGTVNGAFALTLNSTGTTVLGGAVGLGTALTSLTTDGGAGETHINDGAVRTTGGQSYGDAVLVGGSTAFTSTGTGTISFGSTLNGLHPVSVQTGGGVTFTGAVGGVEALTSLDITAATLSAAAITSGGLTVDISGTGSIAGIISGAAAMLVKEGDGTLTLSGLNTYTGDTSINGGQLNINNAVTSDVTVGALGTLGGTGTITGNVDGAGTIAAGASPGVLTIIGDFTPAGTVAFEVNPLGVTAGVDYDQIDVTGAVDLSGATLTFTGTAGAVAVNQLLTLIQNDAADATVTSTNPAQGATVTINGNIYRIFYNGGDGNDVVLVEATPPTTVYVDDSFTQNPGQTITDADLGTAGNQPAIFGISAFTTINAALAAVDVGGTVVVNSGTYGEAVNLNDTTATLLRITGPAVAGTVTINSLASAATTAIQIDGTSSLTVGDATNTTISGALASSGKFVKQGSGTLTLAGASPTYTGNIQVNAGTLAVTNADGLGTTAGTTTVTAGATLDVRANIAAEPISVAGTGVGTNGALITSTGSGTVGGPVTLTANTSIGGAGSLTISGVITDGASSFSVTKVGAGTTTLTAANTYDGGTMVNAGTLLVNNVAGSGTGTGAVDVNNAATLGGTGTITGAVNVNDTAHLAPGTTAPGILSTGDTTWNAGTFFNIQVGGTTAGTDYDQLSVTGAVDLGGVTLSLAQFAGFVPTSATLQTFQIINNDGLDQITGTFAGLLEGAIAGVVGGTTLYITYRGGDGNDVELNTQPVVNGTNGNDTLVLRRLSSTQNEFSLNGAAFVPVASNVHFTFNGHAGTDLLLVDTSNGDPIPVGNVSFDGEILRAQRVTGLASDTATLVPDAVAGNGTLTLTGFGDVLYTGVTNVDLVNLTAATVQTATLDDTLNLSDGNTITNGGTVPAGYSIAPAAAIVVTGAGGVQVGLRNIGTANIDTVTGGGDGKDTVTVSSGTGTHGVTNLSIDTGDGTAGGQDAVVFAGSSTFTGSVLVVTGDGPFGGTIAISGGTTTAATIDLTAGGTITETGTGALSANDLTTSSVGGTTLPNANTVDSFNATNTASGNITLNNTATVLDVTGVSQTGGGLVSVANTGALSVSGTGVSTDGGAVNLTTVGVGKGIAVNAAVDTDSGAIVVTAGGAITQSGGGRFATTDTLTTVSAGGQLLGGANTVAAFNATNATSGAINFTNTAATLDITGIVQAGVAAGSDISVTNTGDLTTTGAIVTTVAANGDIALQASGGELTLGSLVSAGGAGAVDLTTTGAGNAIIVNAAVASGSGAITADASGKITQAGVGLFSTTGGLATSSTGGQALGGANAIGAFNATNDTSGVISLTNTAATLAVTGVSQSGGGLVSVANTGALSITGIGVSADGGAIGLSATGGAMAVGSGVSTTGTGTINLTTTGAGNAVSLNAAVTTGSGAISTNAGGAITQSGGGRFSTTGGLTTNSAGGQSLGGANTVAAFNATNTGGNINLSNTAASLGITGITQTASGNIGVTNIGAVSISGAVSTGAAGAIGLTASGAGNGIAVNAAVSTGSGAITTNAGGTITQGGGGKFSTAGGLTTVSAGGLSLTGANTVGAFNATNAGGNITLSNTAASLGITGITQAAGGNIGVTNSGAVNVSGAVSTSADSTIGLTASGAGNGLALSAAVTTDSGAISATAGGAITQTGGGRFATTNGLTTNSAGGQALGGTNAVTAFNATNATSGAISFNNSASLLNLTGIAQNAAGAPVSVTNSNDVRVTGLLGAANGGLTIRAGGAFTARGTDMSGGSSATELINVGAGGVVIVPGTSSASTLTYDAEIRASSAQFGANGAADNTRDDRFSVRPSQFTNITVIGNNPGNAPGDSLFPITANPAISDIRLIVTNINGDSFDGRYDVTFGGTTKQLAFTSIESFQNLGYRAVVVQTGDHDYSIRMQQFQDRPQAASVTGQAIQANPFVVSPVFVEPNLPYSAPTTAFGDVNGDNAVDLIIANGANDVPLVTIVDGRRLFAVEQNGQMLPTFNLSELSPTNGLLAQFFAIDPSSGFRGGLTVSTADFNGDGKAEIVIGAGNSGGPRVQIFRDFGGDPFTRIGLASDLFAGKETPLANFFAFESSFRGGVNVTTGNIDGDSVPDLIVGAGVGGAPRVVVYSGATGRVIQSFFAYADSLRGGVLVAAGSFDGIGTDEILTGPGYGGAPHIQVFGFDTGSPVQLVSFFALGFTAGSRSSGLQVFGSDAFTGVGGVAFGAPRGTTQTGGGDPSARQEILVSSARGARLRIESYAVDPVTGQLQLQGSDLFSDLTTISVPRPGEDPNSFQIRDSQTGRVLDDSELFEGGSVAGSGG